MSTPALTDSPSGLTVSPPAAPMTAWQVWGLILVAPYLLLIFLISSSSPVGYGFWLARDPHNYVELFDDPIFLRSVGNTLSS